MRAQDDRNSNNLSLADIPSIDVTHNQIGIEEALPAYDFLSNLGPDRPLEDGRGGFRQLFRGLNSFSAPPNVSLTAVSDSQPVQPRD